MLGARYYVWDFWHDKSRVPFLQSYNDGMRLTESILQILGGLAATWSVAGLVTALTRVWS